MPALFTALASILRQSQSIRYRIVTLVLIILIPLVGLFLWVATRYAAVRTELIEVQRFDVTSRIGSAFDREIAITLGMLTGLSGSDDLSNGNFADFRRQAQILVNTQKIGRVWAFGSTGIAMAATMTPDGTGPLPSLEADLAAKVFNGNTVITPVRGSGGSDASAIVAVPIRANNGFVFGVAGEIPLVALSGLFAEAGLESRWIAAVVDGNGRFVARSLDAEHWIGLPARPELYAATQRTNQTGTFDNVTHEGIESRNSFSRSTLTSWTTVVAVPVAELAAPLRRTIILVLLGGAALILTTLAAASVFAARISRPVRQLSLYAHALVNGLPYPRATDNITELNEVRSALESAVAGSARLSAIVASSGDAIVSCDLDGTIRTWNKGAEELFGYTAREAIGQPKTMVLPTDRITEFETHLDVVKTGKSVRAEATRRKRDGTIFPVSLDVAPVYRPDGTIIAISSIIHDITDRKKSEEHKLFLMGELAHRSKNQLAIIQSIANQTGRRANSLTEFLATFQRRIQGLSASYDLLMTQGWSPVGLAELIERQLAVFADIEGSSVALSGPQIGIEASQAEVIGLALHELATNSTKYGALSLPAGRVSIVWQVSPTETGRELHLEWKETGGPAVVPPTSKGFGSMVIEGMITRSVGGTAKIEYLSEGVVWRLDCHLK